MRGYKEWLLGQLDMSPESGFQWLRTLALSEKESDQQEVINACYELARTIVVNRVKIRYKYDPEAKHGRIKDTYINNAAWAILELLGEEAHAAIVAYVEKRDSAN